MNESKKKTAQAFYNGHERSLEAWVLYQDMTACIKAAKRVMFLYERLEDLHKELMCELDTVSEYSAKFEKENQYVIADLLDYCDQEGDAKCFVYYILNQEKDKIKIGISNDPIGRAKNMQTSSGEELEILHTIEFPSREEAMEAERFLHQFYSDYRKRPSKIAKSSEWFDAKIKDELLKYFLSEEQIKKVKMAWGNKMRSEIKGVFNK